MKYILLCIALAAALSSLPFSQTAALSPTKQGVTEGQVVMEGKLRVSDPITNYLKDVPPDKRSITIHHLLTHFRPAEYCRPVL